MEGGGSPDIDHIGAAAAPPVASTSFQVSAHVVRETETENGVIFAHGSVNSGYCLMIEDDHLVYDYNYYGDHHIVRSAVPVPSGESVLGMRFLIDDDGTGGVATLFIGDGSSGR